MPSLILASASPRRRELLTQIGLEFTIYPAEVDEGRQSEEAPADFVRRLALAKARAVAAGLTNGVVLGADTIVVVGETILGKPANPADAFRMLELLSGITHRVITGVAAVDAASGREEALAEVTAVTMRLISPREMGAYVATGEPMDKAGAYAIQGRAGAFVTGIEGCYSNVVGLPLARTTELLAQFGIDPW
ncbi:MAG: Maf family protein [Bacillota bacterium]